MKLVATEFRPRLELIVITIGVLCIIVQCTGQMLDEEYRPGIVGRRASNDIVYKYQYFKSSFRCEADTYVVEEHRCVENKYFFESKSVSTLSLAILQ